MTWRTRHVDEESLPFLVHDGTGTASVDPDGSELLLTSGDEITVDEGAEPPARVREFLESETTLETVSSRRRRYKEIRIAPGDPVLVAGNADPDAIDDLDSSVTTAIGDGPDTPRFYITDDLDHGLRRRLLHEIVAYFFAAAILLSSAAYLFLT